MHLFLLSLLPVCISGYITVLGYNLPLAFRTAESERLPTIRNKLEMLSLSAKGEDKDAAKVALEIIDHDKKTTEELEKVQSFAKSTEAEMAQLAEIVKIAASGDVKEATKLAMQLIEELGPEKAKKIKPQLLSLIDNLKGHEMSHEELELVNMFIAAIGSMKLKSIVEDVVPSHGTETEQKAQELIKDTLVEQETEHLKLALNLGTHLDPSQLSDLNPAVLAAKKQKKGTTLENRNRWGSKNKKKNTLDEDRWDEKKRFSLENRQKSDGMNKERLIGQYTGGPKRLIGENSGNVQKTLCLFTPDRQYCVKQKKEVE